MSHNSEYPAAPRCAQIAPAFGLRNFGYSRNVTGNAIVL
jgi:hypothetical protein